MMLGLGPRDVKKLGTTLWFGPFLEVDPRNFRLIAPLLRQPALFSDYDSRSEKQLCFDGTLSF